MFFIWIFLHFKYTSSFPISSFISFSLSVKYHTLLHLFLFSFHRIQYAITFLQVGTMLKDELLSNHLNNSIAIPNFLFDNNAITNNKISEDSILSLCMIDIIVPFPHSAITHQIFLSKQKLY